VKKLSPSFVTCRTLRPRSVFPEWPIENSSGLELSSGSVWTGRKRGLQRPFVPSHSPDQISSWSSRARRLGAGRRRGARGGDGDRSHPSSTLRRLLVGNASSSSFLPSSLPGARVLARLLPWGVVIQPLAPAGGWEEGGGAGESLERESKSWSESRRGFLAPTTDESSPGGSPCLGAERWRKSLSTPSSAAGMLGRRGRGGCGVWW
jgi:hypothetical protein